jgi:hypothetical protein
MNPSVPQRIIDEAMEADPASAQAEYFATFRVDVETFISREAIEACVAVGCRERPPEADQFYEAFCDPSGGSADSMTLAIGHKIDNVVIIDAIRERRPPFSPDAVVEEFCSLLKAYRIGRISGDRYAGEWPRERFAVRDVTYEPAEKPKSDLYQALLPLINGRRIELLDDKKLIGQLTGLERRTSRAGKDSIDHMPGSHDDVANSVAGCAAMLMAQSSYWDFSWVSDDSGPAPEPALTPYGQRPLRDHPYFGGLPWLLPR